MARSSTATGAKPNARNAKDAVAATANRRRLNSALIWDTRPITRKPSPADTLINQSISLLNSHRDTEKVIEFLNRAIEYDPRDAQAHCLRADALIRTRRLDEAIADSGRAITLDPNFLHAHYIRAFALLTANRFEETIEACGHVFSINPDFAKGYFVRAEAFLGLARDADAIADCERGRTLGEENARVLAVYGVACASLGRYYDAIGAHGRSIELNATEPHDNKPGAGYALLGDALEGAGLYDKARSVCKYAALTNPNDTLASKILAFLDNEKLEEFDYNEEEFSSIDLEEALRRADFALKTAAREISARDNDLDTVPRKDFGQAAFDAALNEVAARYRLPVAAVVKALEQAAAQPTQLARLKWNKDNEADENPAQFAWRAYAAEAAAKTLHLGIIRQEDDDLAVKLVSWLRSPANRKQVPEGFDIPTKPEWITRQAEAGKAQPAPRTEGQRIHDAMRKRRSPGRMAAT